MIYWIAFYIFKVLFFIFSPFSIRGREHVPRSGGYIFASNHLSNLDPMLVGITVHRRVSYLAKKSLFKSKIFSFFLYQVGAFPIRRESSDIGALKEALRRLRAGRPLVVFPVGTRGAEVTAAQAQPGIGFLAVKSKVPVIPVFIQGSDKVLPKGAKWPRRHPVRIFIGNPLSFAPQTPYPEVSRQIMQKILSLAP